MIELKYMEFVNSILDKFSYKGSFSFKSTDSLSKVCNAPRDKNGVYLLYRTTDIEKELIYIGISGMLQPDGSVKTRKGGMRDRIINGKQFEARKTRRNAWPDKMKEDLIEEIFIDWYVTINDEIFYVPRDIEKMLLERYLHLHKRLPVWNKEI